MDWLDLLAVQGTLKNLLQHHSSKISIIWCSAFFIVQLSLPYMTAGKTIALTRQTFVGKVMSLLFNMLSRLVITFLPRSKCLLISWLQSPSEVILEPKKIESATVTEDQARLPVLYSSFPLAIYFTHEKSIYINANFSICPPYPSPSVPTSLFSTSASPFIPCR